MKRQGPDPVLYVVLGLVLITLLSVSLALLAGRSCTKLMTDVTSDTGKPTYEESREFYETAPKVSPEAYSEFVKTVEGIDLGLGVHVGQAAGDVKRALGEPDSVTRVAGGKQAYNYMFPSGAKGPFPDQRHRGGFKDLLGSAMLMLTMKDNAVQELWIGFSPLGKSEEGWAFIKFNGKPLDQCKTEDLSAVLGEPDISKGDVRAWRCAPESAKGMLARQSAYIQATFSRKGSLLADLLIGVTSTPLPPPPAAPPAKTALQPSPKPQSGGGK
jgi:hypothetical protein